jgi:superkiller protein 3
MLLLSGCASLGSLMDGGSLEYRKRMQAQQARAEAVTEKPQAEPPATVEGWLEGGVAATDSGDRARALWHYLEAHRLDPLHPKPLNHLGYFYLSQDTEKSAALFARAIDLDPGDATAHAGLGLARLSQERFDEAAASLEEAVAIDPEFSEAQDALGVVYAIQDDRDASRLRARRARELDPRDPRIVNNHGVSLLADGEWSEAEEAFRSAILLDPTEPSYYNNLGVALGRQGRYSEAQVAFERFGTNQAVHNNLGYLYFLNGDHARAIEHYELALQSGGSDQLTVLRNLKAVTELAATRR